MGVNVMKEETFKLMDRRSAIEAEIDAIITRLSLPGAPGLEGNLLDFEGFPRSDIDVHAVRADRHRLAELKNDHKIVTEKIDQNLQLLHAEAKSASISASENNMEVDNLVSSKSNVCIGNNTAEREATGYIPFAVVDEITESSPAAEDGLQLGDQIVKFGSVESGGENMLPMLAQEMHKNLGSAISVSIMRHGALTSLSVTPRSWQGRGLLGCHFKLL